MKVADVYNLRTSELVPLLTSGSPLRRFILNAVLHSWNASDRIPVRVRKVVVQMMPLTVAGGPLSDLHPGSITVWRGGDMHPGKVESYTTDPEIAKVFGPVQSIELTPDVPALSLDALWGEGSSEAEVIVVTPVRLECVHLLRQLISELKRAVG